jgi:hypothetical protein
MPEAIQTLIANLSEQEKSHLFELFVNEYLKVGFGIMGKADLEVLIYSILEKIGLGTLGNYQKSLVLGITESRIKSLHEKSSVKYSILSEEEAVTRFVEKLKSVTIRDSYIDIPIQDVALRNFLKSKLDEHNLLLQTQLNENIFRLNAEDFLRFINIFNSERDIITEIIEKITTQNVDLSQYGLTIDIGIGEEDIKTKFIAFIKKKGPKIALQIIASLIPGGTIASKFVNAVVEAI